MTQPRNGESTMTDTSAASTPYDRAKLAEANADATTTKPATKTAGKSSTKAKPAKPGKAKAPATKTTVKKGTKPTKRKTAKPAAPSTGKRKDEPIKGELKGATLTNYEKVLKAIPTTKGEALNANQIAKRVNFWPIPCKRYLETAVDRGDAKKATDGSKVTYYKGADKGRKGGS
jgi:hypothetical protein